MTLTLCGARTAALWCGPFSNPNPNTKPNSNPNPNPQA